MDDIVRQIVIAISDVNLLAGDLVGAVGLGLGILTDPETSMPTGQVDGSAAYARKAVDAVFDAYRVTGRRSPSRIGTGAGRAD